MNFSPLPVSDNKFLNYIFVGILVDDKAVTAMFDTRGNTLIPQSLAANLDITYLDQEPIDKDKGFRRARLGSMTLGDLALKDVPVVVCKDEVIDLGKDQFGNEFPADMVLGWNIISQFVFRGDLRKGVLEVQTSDFKKPRNKEKTNTPVFNIVFEGERYKAALDSSRPTSLISENISKKLRPASKDIEQTIKILDIDHEDVIYESKFTFKIDDNTVNIPSTQVDKSLNDKDIQVIFGADLLRLTSWAMYNPLGYFRARN